LNSQGISSRINIPANINMNTHGSTEILPAQAFQNGLPDGRQQNEKAKFEKPQGGIVLNIDQSNSLQMKTSNCVRGTETILVIEDERSLLELARIVLQTNGYKVLTAADGLEAVILYKQHRDNISLVFTDIGLPGINGREVFTRLKEINPDVKVVFTSGIFVDIKDALLKDGAKDFIQKPYKQDQVLQKIREVLDAH
jgi:CheY-like chemotaxis protein